MKRVSTDSHQSGTVHEASETRLKYQNLLLDYLDVQKEFVLKKRKLQSTRQRRETLLAEVRFLSQRREYLLNLKRHFKVEEDGLENLSKALKTKQNLGVVEEEVLMEKKSQNCLRVNKMVGRKKILWRDQDQVIQKV